MIETKTQCKAKSCTHPYEGERCRQPAAPGKDLCWTHQSALDAGTRTREDILSGTSVTGV